MERVRICQQVFLTNNMRNRGHPCRKCFAIRGNCIIRVRTVRTGRRLSVNKRGSLCRNCFVFYFEDHIAYSEPFRPPNMIWPGLKKFFDLIFWGEKLGQRPIFPGPQFSQQFDDLAVTFVKRSCPSCRFKIEQPGKCGLVYGFSIRPIPGHPAAQPFLCAPYPFRAFDSLQSFG